MKNQNRKNNNLQGFSDLNDELGNFGLEPPKIYRGENKNKDKSGKKNKKVNSDKKFDIPKQILTNTNSNKSLNYSSSQEKINSQNKKRKQKHNLRKLFGMLGIIVGIFTVMIVINFVFFNIDTINISGNTIYSNEQIINALEIDYEENLLLSNISKAEMKLEQSLPYVYNAEIKRHFPTGLNIVITEPESIYSIKNSDNSYILVDSDLKVLETNAAKLPSEAIEIKKANVKSATVGFVLELNKQQQQSDLLKLTKLVDELDLKGKITCVYSKSINNNYAVYDNRITVKFGTTENIEDKMYSALTVIEEKLENSNPNAKGVLTATGDKQIYFTEE